MNLHRLELRRHYSGNPLVLVPKNIETLLGCHNAMNFPYSKFPFQYQALPILIYFKWVSCAKIP